MYHIEINNRINQVVEIYRRFGIWRIEDKSIGFGKIGWKLKFLILQLSFSISLIAAGLLSSDNNEFVYLIVMGIAASVATVKLAYILWKTIEISSFIQALGVHSVADYEEFVKANDKVKKLINFSSYVFMMSMLGGGLVSIFSLPVFSSEKRLPVNIWFPLDWKNNALLYWIAFGYVMAGIVCSQGTSLFNMIIWYLMRNCAIKNQILGNDFKNVFLTKSTKEMRMISKDKEENFIHQELIRLIKTHRNNKVTIDRFRRCFENLFFTQITTSGMAICGSVYALAFGTTDEALFQQIFVVMLLFYNFFDIFMIMYLGNEIKSSSDRLSYCLFESNWLERSISTKKCIIILNEVLKPPHELYIGKLYPLNLNTFTSIVNFAYSVFNILKNLN